MTVAVSRRGRIPAPAGPTARPKSDWVLTDFEILRGPLATYSRPAGEWPTYFTDSDGDTLTPSAQAQYPGLLSVSVSTGTDYSIRTVGLNPGTSKLTYGRSVTGYGGVASRTVHLHDRL